MSIIGIVVIAFFTLLIIGAFVESFRASGETNQSTSQTSSGQTNLLSATVIHSPAVKRAEQQTNVSPPRNNRGVVTLGPINTTELLEFRRLLATRLTCEFVERAMKESPGCDR
jgi:hypothetical protein